MLTWSLFETKYLVHPRNEFFLSLMVFVLSLKLQWCFLCPQTFFFLSLNGFISVPTYFRDEDEDEAL